MQPDLIEGVSALPATGRPLLRHVYLVDRNILALTIDEQSVIYGNLRPWIRQKGDTMLMSGYNGLFQVLERRGEEIGYIAGVKKEWYRTFNELAGEKLDIDWISNPTNYHITSLDDKSLATSLTPLRVYRKTVPNKRTHVAENDKIAVSHEIFIVLDENLKHGTNYRIHFEEGGPFKNRVQFIFDENRLRSEAIHVNLYGYHTDEPKIAFLSTWLGDGGGHSYTNNFDFNIIDAYSQEVVFSGKSKLKNPGSQPEFEIENKSYNNNLTDVHSLDFSGFNEPGNYRLVVKGIGCSFEFEIREDVWEKMTRLAMKGFLHQRSGMELGPPYTDYRRPRNMHPADDVTIRKCDVDKFFGVEADGQQGVFKRIQASILMDTEVPEAWGGWLDAADFDQRMDHLFSVRRMMFLHEINPSFFENMNLGIPESSNKIPDILDEAIWCLDLYRRTQGIYEEGAVSWWVESVEHPRRGESSWLNSLPAALVPPTPTACLTYTASAAQMAISLKNYDLELSTEYLKSALAAIKWADENKNAPDPFRSNPRNFIETLAYLNLYKSTGDPKWYLRFKAALASVFVNGFEQNMNKRNAELLANYFLLKGLPRDQNLVDSCKNALITFADALLEGANQNTYDIIRTADESISRTVLPSRCILPIAVAHLITNDRKYTDVMSKTIQYTMGANPMNRSFISGLGERWFIPYQLDWEVANVPAPSGIPTYGPATHTEEKWGWKDNSAAIMLENAGLYPNKLLDWPHVEKCFNNTWIAPINEFTVSHPMGELIFLTGYLAQRDPI
ncbi:MAG: hypothetical protein DHS20C17_22780 [Cyclobacteriaceae bacterium]|nr:MAG: hypothetical protein DHS20C17_22780 [Cyclobacteriaceae bacterium]